MCKGTTSASLSEAYINPQSTSSSSLRLRWAVSRPIWWQMLRALSQDSPSRLCPAASRQATSLPKTPPKPLQGTSNESPVLSVCCRYQRSTRRYSARLPWCLWVLEGWLAVSGANRRPHCNEAAATLTLGEIFVRMLTSGYRISDLKAPETAPSHYTPTLYLIGC